jgi:hypothetical protein
VTAADAGTVTAARIELATANTGVETAGGVAEAAADASYTVRHSLSLPDFELLRKQ